jgi:hypothetical protein
MRAGIRTVIAIGLVATALAARVPNGIPVSAQPTLQIIASGLSNPRGLAFGPEGALYVAEAGRGGAGPCITGGMGLVCYGPTGSITRISPIAAGNQTRIVTGLPSLAPPPTASNAGAGALGPHHIGFLGRGNGWVTIGLGNDPDVRSNLGAAGGNFGRLLRMLPNGRVEYEQDLAEYENSANPDGGLTDSNPFGIAVLPSRTLYTDAGGNTLNEVAANGRISTLAVFPDRQVQNPFAPPGVLMPMQAVPTSVVRGPDGVLYVGQLTGFPFPVGAANVYRVPAEGGTPEVFASGFTNIIDIAFGPDGALYVLEIDSSSLRLGGPEGSLFRVANGTKTTVVGAGLTMPGGMTFGPDGSIYITNMTTSPTAGQVVRVVQ